MNDNPTYEELKQRVKDLEKEVFERSRLEERIRPLSLAIAQSNEGIAVVDLNGKLIILNDAFAKMHGYIAEELTGKNLSIFHTPEQMPSVEAANQQIKESGDFKGEIWHVRRDGTVFPTMMHNSLIRDAEGNPIGIIGTLRDITEIKQTEESIRKEKDKAETYLDIAGVIMIVINADQSVAVINNKGCELLGYEESEIIGKNWIDNFIPEIDRDRTRATFIELVAGNIESVEYFENYVLTKDNKERLITWHNSILRDDSGKIIATVSSGKDITEQKQAEERLRANEEMYRSLFENTGTATFIIEKDMTISQVNLKCEELVGYSKEEIAGKMKASDFVGGINLERIKEYHFGRREEYGTYPSQYELDLVDKHGDTRNTIVQVGMIPGTQQSVASIIDITSLKEAEKALREGEEQYRELANSLPQVVFEMDANGLITFANRNAFDFFGYTQNDFDKGVTAFQMLIPEDRDRVVENIQRRLNGEELGGREYTALKKNGGTFPVAVHVTPVIRDNKPIGLRGIMIDITDQKQAEEEKKKLESQLLQARKMESIGTLAGGIAHDFNNALYAIMGYADLTMDDVPEGSHAQSNLKEVIIAANRAKEMVHQILTFSRKTDTEKKPLKVQSIVKESIKLLRASIPATIEIHQNIDTDCRPVMADPTQVHQIVMNLATNAYHAMREKGGVLTINVEKENVSIDDSAFYPDLHPGKYVKLTVGDTGHGMDKTVIEKIFDPYFTTKPVGEGTGMGLSTVYGIVKSHGGDIKVYSELDKGTVFHVYFPLVETKPVEPTISSAEPVQKGSEHILLVDDEEPLVFMVKQILERLGYQVTSRTGSVDALEAFRAKPDEFDLVITDMAMPNMSGIQLAPKLLEIRSDIPIILCTGFSETTDENRAKALGIREFVMKPVVMDQIARSIRKVLDEGKEK